jgi:hypothetical protein
MSLPVRLTVLALLLVPAALPAQSLDLTINNTGISIGDSRVVHGVRINFRDRNMERVDGINATIWTPYDDARGGTVKGLALGLPLTGAGRISGLGVGVAGVAAESEFSGIGVAGIGIGAGSDVRGILIGGIGVGSGGNVTGLTVGGIGAGAGGNVKGITIAGIGAGAGGNVAGITLAGFGSGAGGNVNGITIAGFGSGAGGDVKGLTIAGIGAGAGGDVTGITLAGVGAGAGGTLRGFAAALGGVGAPVVRGIVVAGMAGGHDVKAGVLAPLYFRIAEDEDGDAGIVRGLTISSLSHIQGQQNGISLGLINYAWEVNGVQIGLLNYAGDNPRGRRWMPLVNW